MLLRHSARDSHSWTLLKLFRLFSIRNYLFVRVHIRDGSPNEVGHEKKFVCNFPLGKRGGIQRIGWKSEVEVARSKDHR